MKKAVLWFALYAAMAAVAIVSMAPAMFAADSFTVTAVADTDDIVGSWDTRNLRVIKAAWKADGSGDKADGTLPSIKGKITKVVTDPGSTAPADNYDITILDAQGVDVMGGALANRDTANSEQAIPLSGALAFPGGGVPVYGPLTISFTNQANADCDGEVYIYYEE